VDREVQKQANMTTDNCIVTQDIKTDNPKIRKRQGSAVEFSHVVASKVKSVKPPEKCQNPAAVNPWGMFKSRENFVELHLA